MTFDDLVRQIKAGEHKGSTRVEIHLTAEGVPMSATFPRPAVTIQFDRRQTERRANDPVDTVQ